MTNLCSICEKPARTRGYCSAHYTRLRRHGDPLGGRTSPGDPLRFIKEIALNHTSKQCLTWPFCKNRDGYGQLWIEGKLAIASRYVCELAHGAPPTPEHQSAHSCGKGHEGCIAPGHLDWKTRAENMADTLEHGTRKRGESHVLAKLTEVDVREILTMKGERQCKLAARFGVTPQTVSSIQSGKSWAWVEGARR